MKPTLAVLLLLLSSGSALPLEAQLPSLRLVQEFRGDSATMSGLFSWVNVTRAGVMVAGDAVSRSLQYSQPEGALLGTLDGAVAGLAGFGLRLWREDTLLLQDPVSNTFSAIGPDRVVVRRIPMMAWGGMPAAAGPPAGSPASGRVVLPETMFPDGSVNVFTDSLHIPAAAWNSRPVGMTHAIIHLSSDGNADRVLAWTTSPAICVLTLPSSRGGQMGVRIPYCAPDLHSRAGDGRPTALVQAFTSGPDSATYRVTMVSAPGDTLWSRKYSFVPNVINSQLRDAEVSRLLEGLQQVDRGVAELARGLVHPPTIAAPWQVVFVGRDGTVWLNAASTSGSSRWTVIDRDGALVGQVQLPANVTFQEADRHTIWGLESIGSRTTRAPNGLMLPSKITVVVRYRVE